MHLVICNSVGSTALCNGCGAAELHYHNSCEACPINSLAKCYDAVELKPNKSHHRVSDGYKKYPKEFAAQYNMLLDDGVQCSQCLNVNRCVSMFGQKETATSCQFYPNRFVLKPATDVVM